MTVTLPNHISVRGLHMEISIVCKECGQRTTNHCWGLCVDCLTGGKDQRNPEYVRELRFA